MNKNTIITVVIAVLVVLLGVGLYMRNSTAKKAAITLENNTVSTQKVSGEVNAIFEGDNRLAYSFSIPSDATSTKKNSTGSLIHVTDASSSLVTAFYFSYEGGRGYTAQDYITEVIAKKIAVLTANGTTTLGNLSGLEVSSNTTVWKIAPTQNGQFLVVVEYPKEKKVVAEEILKTVEVENLDIR